MNIKKLLSLILVMLLFYSYPSLGQIKKVSFSNLSEAEKLDGFQVISVYLNDADQPMGARFIHVATGFTLDLLQIQSVPQSFIYVNSFPVSDKGEPHTQEHLLLTKGNKGHDLNTKMGMSLTKYSAFTDKLYTAYHFYTGGNDQVFYAMFEKFIDALLNPDYTDEEVRREVRNWGVVQSPDKSLRLEEKGSVYNEMYNSMNDPYSILFDTISRLLYGNEHPVSYNSGGLPSGIRILNEKDISRFHQENYWLGNMGAITSLPESMPLESVLSKMNTILLRFHSNSGSETKKVKQLPLPNPAAPGSISVVNVPAENAKQPGTILFAYPPDLNLDVRSYLELFNFLSIFAGDATTNLYKLFVDSKTKLKGIDAQNVFGWIDNKQNTPVFFGLDGVQSEFLTKEKANLARQAIISELEKIASYPDHSPELLAFNKRYENALISTSRYYSKFVNSPPKFGFRNTGSEWYYQLVQLDRMKVFKKSIGLKPQMQEIRDRMATGTNIWKQDIANWKLTTVLPYAVVTHADPEMNPAADSARKSRAEEEVKRLKVLYQLTGDQETIIRYKAIYDSNTVVLEKLEHNNQYHFIDNPPLTMDDQLIFKQQMLPGKIPFFNAVFNNMAGATTGIALSLNGVSRDKLVYLALFPELLTETGYIKNGKAVTYEEMIQQIQQQILSLESSYSTSDISDRAELIVKAAGNNESESKLSIEWINNVLMHPYWEMKNLPRMRDLVEQELTNIRKRMQDREEAWVSDPDFAYENQDKAIILATSSFLTRSHNIFRLKWMLKETENKKDSASISDFLSALKNATPSREQLTKLLNNITAENPVSPDSAGQNKLYAESFNKLPAGAKVLAKDAAIDLIQILNEIPDNSLNTDWPYLCLVIQHGLAQGPENTLRDLNSLRKSLLTINNTRLYLIGSEHTERNVQKDLEQLTSGFATATSIKTVYPNVRYIDQRVKDRLHSNEPIVFAGLINPDSHTGVFQNSAPLTSFRDTSKNALIKMLATQLYAGMGKQSVYTKTTGAGLSYSTGVRENARTGRFSYYAERTPELPQTLKFVINDIKQAAMDTTLVDYTVAQAIGSFRSAMDYESRGEFMAIDLKDEITPELIRNFRKAILKLSKEPGLIYEIYKFKDPVYEKILPGYGIPSKDVKGGSFFVIGPEKQMAAYEGYLKSTSNGPDTKLYRLYPRDFWLVD